jgi:transposase
MAYSKERRLEVLAATHQGQGTKQIALNFGCSESWVRRVKQEFREQGKTEPATTRNRIPEWVEWREKIQDAIIAQPDLTLDELKASINTPLSRTTLCTALQALKLTLKKSPDRHRTKSP